MTKNLYLNYDPNDFSVSGQLEIQKGCYPLLDSQNQPQKFDKEQIDYIVKICPKKILITEICNSNNIA